MDGKISIVVRFLTYRQRNMAFSNNHIGRSHPIGEAMDGKISIVVRFLTYRQRNLVFNNKRKLKGNKDKMCIAENLVQYKYELLRQLNGMEKINKVHYFWTHDGFHTSEGKGEL
jgi:hypothetical protein